MNRESTGARRGDGKRPFGMVALEGDVTRRAAARGTDGGGDGGAGGAAAPGGRRVAGPGAEPIRPRPGAHPVRPRPGLPTGSDYGPAVHIPVLVLDARGRPL
ncbi:hypothetical protein [Allostreptomyces psammosilenae]|uniref:Uncharacterized protein n=1 Tax=Allostreptomyces psammosilenae TaxID=1892865 RepID=A0A852ZPY5_9ACTN|nr:hypothetical protein [Allostreptomyces psammosilenae]NYI03320.1 hypothetical protein [Allostreptomyces psammosilenae]